MSDKDQKDLPKAEDAADDGDIDNLSQTEKAAFEKIMAQISEADDDAIAHTDESKKTVSTNDENAPSDSAQADEPNQSPDTKEEEDHSNDEQQNDEDLSDDQREALDKIMSEISGDDEKSSATSEDDDNEAGDDQQASLDKIMTEIQTEESSSGDAADDDSLSDDQQAALDQIMAEIKGDEPDEMATAPTDAHPESDNDDMGEDPAPVSDLSAESAPPKEPLSKEDASNGLSMEEFDDELSSLLSNPDGDAPTDNKDADKAKPKKLSAAPPDQSLEDINSTLKNIVKASDENETKSDPVDQEDKDLKDKNPKANVLEEINAAPTPKKGASSKSRKVLWAAVATCTAALLTVGSFWGYSLYKKPRPEAPKLADVTTGPVEQESHTSANSKKYRSETRLPKAQPTDKAIDKRDTFITLKKDILSTRQYLQQKKDEILELKRYYQNGIQDERSKLLAKRPSKSLPYNTALKNRQIELGLRSIQRRATYTIKLDTPLAQIERYLEQLLYLERRIRLFEVLDNSISGLSLADLKQQGTTLINSLNKEGEKLSVESVKADPPSLKSIWQELSNDNSADGIPTTTTSPSNPQDRKISKSICKGSYEQKYLLTTLTTQTAECLAKWPGKDLYLNGLTHLSPEAAKQLAQWPGEWLSLNGLRSLTPESARYLSKWRGKRLSLNGVTRLSAETTTYLAQWNGDQLEMIGLTAIGRWENYVTHLFLSENLRRELQVQ